MATKKFEIHSFYCINCGRESIPLPRRYGHQHSKHHRKQLYCPYCKTDVNAIECKTQEDIDEFKKNFEEGLYKEEAKESLMFGNAENNPRWW